MRAFMVLLSYWGVISDIILLAVLLLLWLLIGIRKIRGGSPHSQGGSRRIGRRE